MFHNVTSLQYIDLSSFDTGNVRAMHYMFYGANNLINLDLSNFDTSNLLMTNGMFRNASSLTSLNLSNWNTSNLIWMSGMFFGTSNLSTIKGIEYFNTANVTRMDNVFNGASSLTSLNLSNWDTSNVEWMGGLFFGTSNLTTIKGLEYFNTSNVTSMSLMFRGASSLTNINLSSFDTSNVTHMSHMFAYTSSLTSLDLSNFNTSNVLNMTGMFNNATNLTNLNLYNFNTSNVSLTQSMFANVINLNQLTLGDNFKFNLNWWNYAQLPPVPTNILYTGHWINVGTGTIINLQGNRRYTSTQLMANPVGGLADTWIWVRNITMNLNPSTVIINDNNNSSTSSVIGTAINLISLDTSNLPIGINVAINQTTGIITITGARPIAGQPVINDTFIVPVTRQGITQNLTVNVNLTPLPPGYNNVSVRIIGNGTASANPSNAIQNTIITLNANANSGYNFARWEVYSGGITVLPNSTFIMPNQAVIIYAIFEPITNGSGNNITPPPSGNYNVSIPPSNIGGQEANDTTRRSTTQQPRRPRLYRFIDGNAFTQGSEEPLYVLVFKPYSNITRLRVNDRTLRRNLNFTARIYENNDRYTLIALKPDYMDNLNVLRQRLTMTFGNVNINTHFRVVEPVLYEDEYIYDEPEATPADEADIETQTSYQWQEFLLSMLRISF